MWERSWLGIHLGRFNWGLLHFFLLSNIYQFCFLCRSFLLGRFLFDSLCLTLRLHRHQASLQNQNTILTVAHLVGANISVALQRNRVYTMVATARAFGFLPWFRSFFWTGWFREHDVVHLQSMQRRNITPTTLTRSRWEWIGLQGIALKWHFIIWLTVCNGCFNLKVPKGTP